jgi:uncharacterized protein YjbI with pentapeptide repeats
MENLPEEILAEIFSYLDGLELITASRVCSLFKLVITTHTRTVKVKLSNEKRFENILKSLEDFPSLRKLRLEIMFDVRNIEKSNFCNQFRDKLTDLKLSEMTFLNPFFDNPDISFCNLKSLSIENSDLSTCSSEFSRFVLRCSKLKKLTINGCSGLEIDSLNFLGQNLDQTKLEEFNLFPTYCYLDVPVGQYWRIENLTSLSVRSKLIVMKKNFAKNLIGSKSIKLKTLELVAEVDAGEGLVTTIMSNFPNLEKLSLGKGCSQVKNEDFSTLCNFYSRMKSLEFHFSHSHTELDLRSLQKNEQICELTLGLTRNITTDNLKTISKNLPNLTRISIVLYCHMTPNQHFLCLFRKVFPKVIHLDFQRTGMSENMKFTSIHEEVHSPHLRHFDDIAKYAI